MIIKINNISYMLVYVDATLEAPAGDGASVTTALNQLPEVLADNTCYIMRRTPEDKKYILKEQSTEFTNLALLGMPQEDDDKYYPLIPEEVKSAWGNDISKYAHLEAKYDDEVDVRNSYHNFIKSSNINNFILVNCYLSRSQNNYKTDYNFPNIIYLNNIRAYVDIHGCRLGYWEINPDTESWRSYPKFPEGNNIYKYQHRCMGYINIEKAREVYVSKNVIISWSGTNENSGIDEARKQSSAIYIKEVNTFIVDNNILYHMSNNEEFLRIIEVNNNVEDFKFTNNIVYQVIGATTSNYKSSDVIRLENSKMTYICNNKFSYLQLALSHVHLIEGYFVSGTHIGNLTCNYNIVDYGETKNATPGMLYIEELYDGYMGKINPEIKNNIIKGYNKYPAEKGSRSAMYIRKIASKMKNNDNYNEYQQTSRFVGRTVVDSCDIQCPYGMALENESWLTVKNSTVSGLIKIGGSATIDLKSYKNYMANTTGIEIQNYDNYVRIRDFWIDKESENYPYSGEQQISNSPHNSNCVYVDKSNCKLSDFNLNSDQMYRLQNVSYICPNMEQAGHYWQSTSGAICESWNVKRTGSTSEASLKLANNNQPNPAYSLIIGNSPFKGFLVTPSKLGKQNLECHIAYKNFSADNMECLMREHVVFEAIVPYKVENGDIWYKSVFSNMNGFWKDDTQAEWVNDTDLNQKVLTLPLDITVENEPVEICIHYNWYDTSGFCYIDPDIKLS